MDFAKSGSESVTVGGRGAEGAGVAARRRGGVEASERIRKQKDVGAGDRSD